MKKLVVGLFGVLAVFVFYMFLSCSKVDSRLQGVYTHNVKGNDGLGNVEINEEVRFNGNIFKQSISITKYGNKDEGEGEFKIKIIFKNDNGGAFYAIPSSLPDDYFDNPSIRGVWGYTLSGSKLILENDKGNKTSYSRK